MLGQELCNFFLKQRKINRRVRNFFLVCKFKKENLESVIKKKDFFIFSSDEYIESIVD